MLSMRIRLAIFGLVFHVGVASLAIGEEAPLPSLQALEAAGTTIGEIRISNQNIFDTADPQENNILFRAANALHIRTQPYVIRRTLLFKSGDPLSVRLLEETERLMRNNRYIYDVRIQAYAVHDGVVDLDVVTRDTWTLNPGVSFSRSGGSNSSGLSLVELNLLGTGSKLSYAKTSTVDRSGEEFSLGQDHAFDGWTSLNLSQAKNSDGKRNNLLIDRPFYALDTRWAAGVRNLDDERIESVYSAGAVSAQYRRRTRETETYAGWSAGWQNGRVRRWSAGLLWRQENYASAPGLTAPASLPSDEDLVAPFVRYEVIEDDVVKVRNRNQIGRPEYFPMGFSAKTTLYRADKAVHSQRNLWILESRVSNGFVPGPGDALLASVELNGKFGDARIERQAIGTALSYYHPHRDSSLFFMGFSADILRHGAVSENLQLGGDNGLRGYPLRYQTGINRILLTVENRFYTDWYPFRLLRVGGAIFADAGRAWGGKNPDPNSQRWLGDIGIGLRIASVRAAFGNVLHADIALPIDPAPGIKKVQFLVKTKFSY